MVSGRKDDAGKRPWHLLPWESAGLIVDVMAFGVTKYGRDTWWSVDQERWFGATIRHLTAWRSGERLDPESGLPHLAHAACSVLFMLAIDEDSRLEPF